MPRPFLRFRDIDAGFSPALVKVYKTRHSSHETNVVGYRGGCRGATHVSGWISNVMPSTYRAIDEGSIKKFDIRYRPQSSHNDIFLSSVHPLRLKK